MNDAKQEPLATLLVTLLAELNRAGMAASADGLLDVFWLAQQLPSSSPKRVGPEPGQSAPKQRSVRPPPPDQPPLQRNAASSKDRPSEPARAGERLQVFTRPNSAADQAVRVQGAPSLPGSLQLARALKPLRRRVPARRHKELDEAATVDAIARTGVWLHVERSTRGRWLDLALVIDDARSMVVWERVILSLHKFFRRSGVFRSVTLWALGTSHEEGVVLYRSFGQSRTRMLQRHLQDPERRTLLLLATDATSRAWHRGSINDWIAAQGRRGPVALLQMLPPAWWSRTALRRARDGWFRCTEPGVPNGRYLEDGGRTRRRSAAGSLEPRAVPIPVVSLSLLSIQPWARAVAGHPAARMRGVRLRPGREQRQSFDAEPAPAAERLSAEERVASFERTASAVAVVLARLLAVAPLTFPIMRMVMQIAAPHATLIELAEVLYAGLTRFSSSEPERGAASESALLEFHEGVRELLLAKVPAWQVEALLLELARRIGSLEAGEGSFVAWLNDVRSKRAPAGAQLLAEVEAKVVQSLGPRYARLLDRAADPIERAVQAVGRLVSDGAPQVTLTLLTPDLVLVPTLAVSHLDIERLRFVLGGGHAQPISPPFGLDPASFHQRLTLGQVQLSVVATQAGEREQLARYVGWGQPGELQAARGPVLIAQPGGDGESGLVSAQGLELERARGEVRYSALPVPVSSGAPILDEEGCLLGFHTGVGSDPSAGAGVLYENLRSALLAQAPALAGLPLPSTYGLQPVFLELVQLAGAYEQLRARLRSGGARTRLMEELLADVAERFRGRVSDESLESLFLRGPGGRVIALGCIDGKGPVALATQGIGQPRSPFEQWTALLAGGRLLDADGERAVPVLRAILDQNDDPKSLLHTPGDASRTLLAAAVLRKAWSASGHSGEPDLRALRDLLAPRSSSDVDVPDAPEAARRGLAGPLERQLLALIGASHDGGEAQAPIVVGTLGPLPEVGGFPVGMSVQVLGAPQSTPQAPSDYTPSVLGAVQLVAPSARFKLVPTGMNADAEAIFGALHVLLDAPVDVLLLTYGPLHELSRDAGQLHRLVNVAAERGVILVAAAGNDAGKSYADVDRTLSDVLERVLLVSAVDRHGARAYYTAESRFSVWAPGEVPTGLAGAAEALDEERRLRRGTSYAAALSAGVVARALGEGVPRHTLVAVLRESSKSHAGGPPLLNLDAALARHREQPEREPARSGKEDGLSPGPSIRIPTGVVYRDPPDEHYGDWVVTRGTHRLAPSEFRICPHLVTNKAFFDFVADAGYDNSSFWQATAWGGARATRTKHFRTRDRRVMGPAMWPSARYPQAQATRPVSGICYAEAVAFVAWLNARRPEPSGRWQWALPTEDMWEFAARGEAGSIYPWGNEFRDGACNSVEQRLKTTSPTTQFPNGISWSGGYDFAGNVWELVEASDQPAGECVLRGGSYRNNAKEVRSYLRLFGVAHDHRAKDFGFRCAQIRSPSLE